MSWDSIKDMAGAGTAALIGGYLMGPQGAAVGAGIWQGEQNYKQQQALFDYQKSLQQQMFAREDTSIQRRTLDMQMAGLSPVLAAGNGASAGPVISTQAPQRQSIDVAQILNAIKMKTDISLTEAQKLAVQAQTDHTLNQIKIENELLPSQIDQQVAGAQSSRAAAALAMANYRKTIIDAMNAEATGVGGSDFLSNLLRGARGLGVNSADALLSRMGRGEGLAINNSNPLAPVYFNGDVVTRRRTINGREVIQTLRSNGEWR